MVQRPWRYGIKCLIFRQSKVILSDIQTKWNKPMSTANLVETSATPSFPASEIESRIREFLAQEAEVQTALDTKQTRETGTRGEFGPTANTRFSGNVEV